MFQSSGTKVLLVNVLRKPIITTFKSLNYGGNYLMANWIITGFKTRHGRDVMSISRNCLPIRARSVSFCRLFSFTSSARLRYWSSDFHFSWPCQPTRYFNWTSLAALGSTSMEICSMLLVVIINHISFSKQFYLEIAPDIMVPLSGNTYMDILN